MLKRETLEILILRLIVSTLYDAFRPSHKYAKSIQSLENVTVKGRFLVDQQ